MLSNTLSLDEEEEVQSELLRLQEEAVSAIFTVVSITDPNRFCRPGTLHRRSLSSFPCHQQQNLSFQTQTVSFKSAIHCQASYFFFQNAVSEAEEPQEERARVPITA